MEKSDGRIAQANGRLKLAKIGVKIERIGNRLYLQGTFPPKPNSTKTKPYQQRIALKLLANTEAVKQAEFEARKVGGLLVCKEFDWNLYLTFDTMTQSVGYWVKRFEEDYFSKRQRTPKTETTWSVEYQRVFNRFSPEEIMTPELLRNVILTTKPDTRTRRRFAITLGAIAKFAGLDCDFKDLKGNYSRKKASPRDLPNDETIARWFYRIKNPSWRWVYGILATYGLRPHEVFWIEPESLSTSGVVTITDGKTGARRVYPIFPEWVNEFHLTSPQPPLCTGKNNSELGHRVTVAFTREGVPFPPYALRHCWAIRSLAFGLDVSLAAQQMGHSVQVHTDIYHQWISDRYHQKAFEALLNRSDRPMPPSLLNEVAVSPQSSNGFRIP